MGVLAERAGLLDTENAFKIGPYIKTHRGAIEGVAGPETANNAGATSAFIPLFALGIPANVVMAVILGALVIHGVKPGPLLLAQHPEILWGTVTSMYVGNIMLLLLNLPLIGIWVKVLKIPPRIFYPLILIICIICIIGAYSINQGWVHH